LAKKWECKSITNPADKFRAKERWEGLGEGSRVASPQQFASGAGRTEKLDIKS
jgi:hypothetical protein